jgi:predicted RNase H-like HicB family nuclease
MSTDSNTTPADTPRAKITLTQNDGGWWTARDERRGLTTQAETRTEALSTLDDVIDAVENDRGDRPTDMELQAAGIDPEDNTTGEDELPDVLK